MSRSARQWNDYRAHIKLLEGDLNECHRWYGLALIRLKFLLEQQPGSVTDAMVPADGVYIRVDTRPNRVHIKVEPNGVYVESGFLSLLSTAECAEQTYLPAILKYNTAVQNYITATVTPLQGKVIYDAINVALDEYPFTGEVLADNSESKALGCSTKLATINPCGTEYTLGGYCDSAIRLKKLCHALIPSSLFSGKIRLFVQAIYGSLRTDFSCLSVSPDFKLYLASVPLSGFYVNNAGLYTTADYRYFLVIVGEASATVRELVLNDLGQQIRQYLIANTVSNDRKRRLECYALAYATLSETITTVSISGVSVLGFSLANAGYAWKYDGSEADIVMHEANGTTRNYTARHYKLNISAIETSGVYAFTISRSLVSSSDWWPIDGKINVIYPNYALGDTQMMPLIGSVPYKHIKGSLTGSGTSSYNAKIFCFRDDNDVLQIASVNYSVRFSATSINEADPVPAEAGIPFILQHSRSAGTLGIYIGSFSVVIGNIATYSESIDYSANTIFIEKQLSGDPVYYGFTYPGSNNNYFPYPSSLLPLNTRAASGVPYVGDNLSTWMVNHGYWVNGSQSVVAGYTDRGDGTQTEIYYGVDLYLQWYRWYQIEATSVDLNPSLFFEIPYGSFNSFFAGKYSFDASSSKTVRDSDALPITNRPWSPHHFEVITYYQNQNGVPTKIATIGVSQICTMMYYDVTGAIIEQYTGNKNLKRQYIDYIDINNNLSNLVNTSQTTADQGQNWHFEGQVITPMLGSLETSRVSFSGSKYDFKFGGAITGDFDFPADSAVGWA